MSQTTNLRFYNAFGVLVDFTCLIKIFGPIWLMSQQVPRACISLY